MIGSVPSVTAHTGGTVLDQAHAADPIRSPHQPGLDRGRIATLREREEARFAAERPKSLEMVQRAHRSLLGGVPMNWMTKWPGGFPPFIASASGSRLVDVDGNEYVDLCYGDTGAMAGHAPAGSVAAIQDRVANGITFMLPTEDAIWVGEEMTRRFGVPFWQFALTATDANRFVLRLARMITGTRAVAAGSRRLEWGCANGTSSRGGVVEAESWCLR